MEVLPRRVVSLTGVLEMHRPSDQQVPGKTRPQLLRPRRGMVCVCWGGGTPLAAHWSLSELAAHGVGTQPTQWLHFK